MTQQVGKPITSAELAKRAVKTIQTYPENGIVVATAEKALNVAADTAETLPEILDVMGSLLQLYPEGWPEA